MSDELEMYKKAFHESDALNLQWSRKFDTDRIVRIKLEQENADLLRCLDGKPNHWSNIIYDKNKEIENLEQENTKLKEILEQLIEATEYDVNHWQMAFSPMEETKGQIAIREAKELTNR